MGVIVVLIVDICLRTPRRQHHGPSISRCFERPPTPASPSRGEVKKAKQEVSPLRSLNRTAVDLIRQSTFPDVIFEVRWIRGSSPRMTAENDEMDETCWLSDHKFVPPIPVFLSRNL